MPYLAIFAKFHNKIDPWPLTFWPMTSPFWDLLAITKTHIGYKFHQDPPMGTWWKVVDCLTDSLTHWLTNSHYHFYGWAMPPKNRLEPHGPQNAGIDKGYCKCLEDTKVNMQIMYQWPAQPKALHLNDAQFYCKSQTLGILLNVCAELMVTSHE